MVTTNTCCAIGYQLNGLKGKGVMKTAKQCITCIRDRSPRSSSIFKSANSLMSTAHLPKINTYLKKTVIKS